MARRRGPVLLTNRDAEKAEIVQWYRDRLEECAPPADLAWNPITIGPTWQYSNGWVLPEFTMGWEQLSWSGLHLRNSKARAPWAYTMEQARVILWFYAVNECGTFTDDQYVLQRLKGFGKDPIAASITSRRLPPTFHVLATAVSGTTAVGQANSALGTSCGISGLLS